MEVAIVQGVLTLLGIGLTGYFSTRAAVINSNARAAKTEQKVEDTLELLQNEYNELKAGLKGLSETEGCCANLQGDVKEIKENITNLNAAFNQQKAKSDEFDDKLTQAFRAIAADRVSQAHRYFMAKGQITESSKKAIHDIYAAYKRLEGNGYLDVEMDDLNKLPEV